MEQTLLRTLLQIIILVCGGMDLFDAIVNSFATAGTGGFAIKADGIAGYNNFCQVVIAVFMMLFGINFNFFFINNFPISMFCNFF